MLVVIASCAVCFQLGEVAALRREIDRQKDLVETQEVKTKWAQNKLKAETEMHKVGRYRLHP